MKLLIKINDGAKDDANDFYDICNCFCWRTPISYLSPRIAHSFNTMSARSITALSGGRHSKALNSQWYRFTLRHDGDNLPTIQNVIKRLH